MSRAINMGLLQKTYEVIKTQAGISISEIARTTKTDYTGVINRLVTMESLGLLLYEDDKGLIYLFNDSLTKYSIPHTRGGEPPQLDRVRQPAPYSPHTWG